MEVLVDEYCNQTHFALGGQGFNNYNYTSIPVDWAAFFALWQLGPQNLTTFNKTDLKLWVDNYNQFINAGGESIMVQIRPIPIPPSNASVNVTGNETAQNASAAAGENQTSAGNATVAENATTTGNQTGSINITIGGSRRL